MSLKQYSRQRIDTWQMWLTEKNENKKRNHKSLRGPSCCRVSRHLPSLPVAEHRLATYPPRRSRNADRLYPPEEGARRGRALERGQQADAEALPNLASGEQGDAGSGRRGRKAPPDLVIGGEEADRHHHRTATTTRPPPPVGKNREGGERERTMGKNKGGEEEEG
jgi:hypothetical protein